MRCGTKEYKTFNNRKLYGYHFMVLTSDGWAEKFAQNYDSRLLGDINPEEAGWKQVIDGRVYKYDSKILYYDISQ